MAVIGEMARQLPMAPASPAKSRMARAIRDYLERLTSEEAFVAALQVPSSRARTRITLFTPPRHFLGP